MRWVGVAQWTPTPSGADSVAIITRYADQARAIRARLKEGAADQADGRRIECSTVHRFQGQERDIVILDTVDAEPMTPVAPALLSTMTAWPRSWP